jgi:hypothetical protein
VLECSGLVSHPDIGAFEFPVDSDGPNIQGTFTAPTVTPAPTVDTEFLLDIDVSCQFVPDGGGGGGGGGSPTEGLFDLFVYDTEVFALQVPGAEAPPTTVPDVAGDVVTATPTFTG